MKIVLSEPWKYTLYQEGEAMKLVVLCGTHALYEVFVDLEPEEIKGWKEKGKGYIDSLALEVHSSPDRFRRRKEAKEKGKGGLE